MREVFSIARILGEDVEAGTVHVRWAPIKGRSFPHEWIPANRLQGGRHVGPFISHHAADGDLLDFRTRVAFETATTSVRLTGPSSGPAAQLQLQILAGL